MIKYIISMLGFISLVGLTLPAFAESMKENLDALQILSLKFGVNEFTVGGNKIIIVKGARLSDTAGGGDTYQTLIEMKYAHDITKESPFWQSVAVNGKDSFIYLQQTAPHTYEDAVTSIQFMIKKNEAGLKDFSAVYLFRSQRDFPGILIDPSFTNLSLYVLKYPSTDTRGIIYFEPVSSIKTKKKYSSADCAAYLELGVDLPSYISKEECLR